MAAWAQPATDGESNNQRSSAPSSDVVAPKVISAHIDPPSDLKEPAEVVLELVVDGLGDVTEAHAVEGPEQWRSDAEGAALKFRFAPATRAGKAVASKIRFLVRFVPSVAEPVSHTDEPASAAPNRKGSAPKKAQKDVEVTVTGTRNIEISTRIDRVEAREIPGTFGDPLRAVESSPGVTPIYTGVPFFFVRGAPPGDVGYYIDGIRIPLLYHALLGPSVIHPGLIDHVDIYRGAAPARYGSSAGATVTAESRGPLSRAGGEGNLRVFDVGALAETPLAGGRLHAMAGGRYSYSALIASMLSGATLAYWDYQTRLSYDLDRSNRLVLTVFGAFDKFEANSKKSTDTGDSENLYGGGLQFHRIDLRDDYANGRTRARIASTVGYDRTSTNSGYLKNPNFNNRSFIEHRVSDEFSFNLGHEASVGDYSLKVPSTVAGFDILRALFPTRRDMMAGAFAEASWSPNSWLTLTPGVRADGFRSNRDTAYSQDVRFSSVIQAGRAIRLIESVGTAHQPPGFVPQIPGAQLGSLSGGLQSSVQASSTAIVQVAEELSASFAVFYANYGNLVDPISQDRSFDLTTIEPDVLMNSRVQGVAYGLEMELKRPFTKRLGGFITYTLSRSERTDKGISSLSGYDRTHVFQGALSYDLGRNWRVGSRLMAYSGLPARQQLSRGSSIYIFNGDRRAPAFFRLDARIEKRWPFSSKGYWAVVFEMLNASLSQEVTAYTCATTCKRETSGPVSIPSIGLEVYAY